MGKPTRAQWDGVRVKVLAARARYDAVLDRLRAKYGTIYLTYATKTEKTQLEAAQHRLYRAYGRIYVYLEDSPRDWTSVPASWIAEDLTYDDAFTEGPLSVTPPLAYGYTRHEFSVRLHEA